MADPQKEKHGEDGGDEKKEEPDANEENNESVESTETTETVETTEQNNTEAGSASEANKAGEIVPSISITKVSQPTPETSSERSPPPPPPPQQPQETFQISVKKDLTSDLTDPLTEDIVQVEAGDGEAGLLSSPPVTSQFSPYFPPAPYSLTNPLVSMTNLAAMYQQTSPTKVVSKERNVISSSQRSLEWYRHTSQEGSVALDLLPEDINSIMSQSTTPYCPICNKDCANFPNLRSHLQVGIIFRSLSLY